MKSVLLPLGMVLMSLVSYAQSPSLSISQLSNWSPDSITQYNDIWGYQDCNGNEFALIGSKFKIHFIDLADQNNPQEVASFSGGQGTTWRDIKTFRNRAYAVSDNTTEGLMIFDLSNLPQSVSKTYHGNSLFSDAHNIFIDELHARMYVVGSSSGNILIYDLSQDPDNPTLLANTTLPGGYVHDVYVRDNIAYCSHLSAGMYVYDCTDPNDIQTLGSVTDYLGTVFNHSSWLSDDGETLIMCDETHGAPVKVADVSDLSDISVPADQMFSSTLLAPGSTNSIAHNPFIRENYLFISYYHEGVQVYDISDTDAIERVAYFDTDTTNTNYNGFLGCWGVYPFLSSGTIIATDINNGLFVLSMDEVELDPNLEDFEPYAEVELLNGPILCEGDSAILSVPYQVGLNYTWRKDNEILQTDGNVLTVHDNGNYQLEVSNGTCNAFSSVDTIEFRTPPDLSDMNGDQVEMCVGDNYMIVAPTGMDNYIWMQDGNVLTNSNNLIQTVESGTYTLLAYKNGCPAFSAPYEITINEVPNSAIALVQDSPCEGDILTLSSTEGADSYEWYKNGDLVAATNEPFFDTEEEGNYTVTLAVGECHETSEEFLLEIYEAPDNTISLIGSPVFCEGESVVLKADENADSWSWYLDSTVVSSASSIEVSNTGFYELVVANSSGCTADNQQYVEMMTAQTPEIIMQNGDLMSSNATSYQWYISDQPISGATNQFYTPTENGSYSVLITNPAGCTSLSEPFEITTVSTNTPESLSVVSLFPNPVRDVLQIAVNNSKAITIELFSANGKLLQKREVEPSGNLTTEMSLLVYPTGLYFVKITNSDGYTTQKIMKE